PFGYTGYQKDKVAGTYFAQAREYMPKNACFMEKDLAIGFLDMPFSLNNYIYCFNSPITLVDLNGAWPQWVEDAGQAIDDAANWVGDKVSDVARWGYEEIWSKHIYGEDTVIYEMDALGGKYEVTSHRGGNLIVTQKDRRGNFSGWSANLSVDLLGGVTIGNKLTGKSWNSETWKYSNSIKCQDSKTGLSYKGGGYIDKEGIGINSTFGGTTGNMPLPLPDRTYINDYADVSWSLSSDLQIANWRQVAETVGLVGAIALLVVLVVDDGTIIGVIDDGLIVPVLGYLATVAPNLYAQFINAASNLATCGG
ncbi:MAG: RHS repeat-associated core domain-containing protein, partial [Lachnospiraceae bacterium]